MAVCKQMKLCSLNWVSSLNLFPDIRKGVDTNSNTHFNPLKGNFSDKLLIIVENLNFQFVEIFDFPRNVSMEGFDFFLMSAFPQKNVFWEYRSNTNRTGPHNLGQVRKR